LKDPTASEAPDDIATERPSHSRPTGTDSRS
jgi:hypothetical protein